MPENQSPWHPSHPDPVLSDRVTIHLGGECVSILLEVQSGRVVGSIRGPEAMRVNIDRARDRSAVIWLDPRRRPGKPPVMKSRKRKVWGDIDHA
jgi:hypothetical protein